MKVHNPLNNILGSKVKVGCLRHLCNYPTELNGNQLSKFIGITPRSIHKAMSDLVNEGVVNLTPHGNSFGYSMNREKWITKHLLLPLFQEEKGFLETISKHIKTYIGLSICKENILSVVLFGSVQRQEETSRSDFDLFVLVDKEVSVGSVEEDVEKLGTELIKFYGVSLGPYIKSAASFKRDRSLAVIKSIIASHRIIYGQELAKYVR